jgi:hypothetical protein
MIFLFNFIGLEFDYLIALIQMIFFHCLHSILLTH